MTDKRAFALIFSALLACKGDGPSGSPLVQKITAADQLIAGREATGRIGDYLLANGRVRFVVQDAGSATGWGIYGGSLIDLARAGGGDDRLQEIFYQCELRAFEPLAVELVNDGRDGKPAILRYTGRDRGIPLIDAAFTTQALGLEMSVDYVLPPDGDTLEIILRAKDVNRGGSRELSCGLVFLRGDGLDGFTEGSGFGRDTPAELPYLAAAADDSESSYVLWAKSGPLSAQLEQEEVTPLTVGVRNVPGGGTLEEHFFVAVGRGDVESAIAERRRVLGEAAGSPVSITVTAPSPELAVEVPRAVLVVSREGRAVTSARAVDGVASMALAAGDYHVAAMLDGREVGAADFSVAAPATSASVALGGLGRLEITTTRAGEPPSPVKLSLLRGLDAPPDGAVELEKYIGAHDVLTVFAGDYTAYISRGPEYDLFRGNISVPAGGHAMLAAQVSHVVDTTGWVSADLHVHMTKSVDATSPRPTRVLGAAAEGLDILVSTDHDIVTDYLATAQELGVDSILRTISGTEVSPAYGHINAMPLVPETPEAYWRVQWYEYEDALFKRVLDPAELVRNLRAMPGIEYIQINHPRSGQGVFNFIRLDVATGMSEKEFPAADGFEILNSRGGGPFDEALADFVILTKTGRRMTATGVSDAHDAYDGVGYARTMIHAGDDVAAGELFQKLREGRAIALSGPFVTFEVNGSSIGDTLVAAANESVELHVKVQAPAWMDVATYRVLKNGAELASGTITETAVVRLDEMIPDTVAADAFYLVIVEGSPGSRNEPVMHARARTVTNPIFVDVGGDGLSF